MPAIKNILFPTDFSERCREVAALVGSLTRHFDAQLTLIHSTGVSPDSQLTYAVKIAEALRAEIHQAASASMQTLIAREFGPAQVRSVIEEGDPAMMIVDYAQKHGIDLIMMPTHGYGPFRRFLIGSVTAKVLHDAQCPVWTSAHTDQPCPPSSNGSRTILCAVDRGASSVPLMQWAAWLADSYGAMLKLAHVVPAVDETSLNRGEAEVRRYLVCKAEEEFAGWIQEAGVNANLIVRGGAVAAGVADTATKEKAELLVIGRGCLQRKLGGLRTHSLAIIREAPCPVISL